MKKQTFIVILLLVCIVFSVIQSSLALESLARPDVTVPDHWKLDDETPYPDILGEHDPDGCGLLEYSNPDTAAFVFIYYESALGVTYSYNELEDEAVVIFNRNSLEDFPFEDSGTMTVAGVPAGYVKGHDTEYDLYYMQLVFVKDDYYFDLRCGYQHQSSDESAVSSLINSISIETGGGGGGEFPLVPLIIILAVIIVVVVVVLVVFLLLKRRKKQPAGQTPAQLRVTAEPSTTPKGTSV